MTLSCIVVGDESLLIGCAEALLARGHRIAAVVSEDTDILSWAKGKGLPQSRQITDLTQTIAPGSVDWLLSIANLRLIPETVLTLPTRGAVNFHDGPLPRYAGLNTPAWALMAGETNYGVSWHMIESGIDRGDLLAQSLFDVAPDETAFSLNSKCYGAALESFNTVLDQLETGLNPRRKTCQNAAILGVTNAPLARVFWISPARRPPWRHRCAP